MLDYVNSDCLLALALAALTGHVHVKPPVGVGDAVI
jgi:hypothetical protein